MEPVLNKTLQKLAERAKELECLHNIEEAVSVPGISEGTLFNKLLGIIPQGMQYSTVCEVQVKYGDSVYCTEDFRETDWMIQSDLVVDTNKVGHIKVAYTQPIKDKDEKQFLPEEIKLLDNIASRISCWLFVMVIKAAEKKKKGL